MNTKVEYTIGDNILEIIERSVYHSYNGKVDFVGPDPKRDFELKTGLAGYKQFNEAIKELSIKSGLVINASDIGTITGNSATSAFTSYTAPFLGTFKCVLDPALDHLNEIDIDDNPWINGWRTSSYSYQLTDEATGNTIDIIATGIREPRGPVKYYWVRYNELIEHKVAATSCCMDIHPFSSVWKTAIIDWKQITKEEYELFYKVTTN